MLSRSDLYNYQRHAVDFIMSKRNCALWIDCGLGKTVSALTAFADMQDTLQAGHMLVNAPKRIARKVWSDEVKEWEHLRHLKVVPIVGDAQECFERMREPADVHTIGRDRTAWLHAQFIQNGKQTVRWPWDIVTLDEAQGFASADSQRFNCMLDLRIKTRFERLIELSGTPLTNGYLKLWSQIFLLDRGKRLGNNPEAMKQRWFNAPIGLFNKWALKPFAEREIQNVLKDFVLALREEDYIDLPPAVDHFIRCEMSGAAKATYKRFEREFIAEVAGKSLTAANSAVLDGKLLQLANGACYHGAGKERTWVPFHDAKIEALEETLDAIPSKCLIVYTFDHDLARISKVLDSESHTAKTVWRVLRTDADFAAWARGEIDRGVIHPASAGHGLNDVYKAGAEDMIFFGLTNNHEFHKQVRARLEGGHRRAGRNVRFHYIVTDGTRDDDYVKLLRAKACDEDNLMAALAVRIQ